MQTGHLAFLLHAHLPFVRHPKYEDFLEEEWLFEAIAETYLPLLKVFLRLAEEEIPFRMTMTITPTLCAMLRDQLLQRRAVRYLERGIVISHKEIERTSGNHLLQELARFYLAKFSEAHKLYVDKLKCDLLGAFSSLERAGHLELITSAATHGFLPLMENFPEAMRAQISIGVDYHTECFGRHPTGIWLPECGYVPSVDKFLVENNLRWFIVDTHGVSNATPRPRFAIFSPYYTPSGPACFARDRESSKQVWSAREGYPGDPTYRDFYRDIGYDLPEEILSDYFHTGGQRYTGIKYYSITGNSLKKNLYCRALAMEAANAHAQNFMETRVRQMEQLCSCLPITPIVVSPFDAELFGHWWFEGPEFLDSFLRKSAFDQARYCLSTPTEYLALHATLQVLTPAPSSWGHKGYWQFWLDRSNAWIYPHLHAATRRMIETAQRFKQENTSAHEERTLRQMARELLLAQSSDWAFLIKAGTACNYATRRTRDHLLRFTQLYENLKSGYHDSVFLQECEDYNNLFPQVNWRYYLEKS